MSILVRLLVVVVGVGIIVAAKYTGLSELALIGAGVTGWAVPSGALRKHVDAKPAE
jgi:hypothetical protein